MKVPPTLRRAVLRLVPVLLTFAAASVAADDVLEIRRVVEQYDANDHLVQAGEETGVLYVESGRARYDQGAQVSWILLQDEGRLILLSHDSATYQELSLPVRLEDYLPEAQHAQVVAMEDAMAPQMTLHRTDEERTIGSWRARKTEISGSPSANEDEYEYELWMAQGVLVDAGIFGELTRSFGALNIVLRKTAGMLADLDGFPVLRRSVTRSPGSYLVDSRTLVSAERRDVPDSIYRPPANYTWVPFQVGDWIQID